MMRSIVLVNLVPVSVNKLKTGSLATSVKFCSGSALPGSISAHIIRLSGRNSSTTCWWALQGMIYPQQSGHTIPETCFILELDIS